MATGNWPRGLSSTKHHGFRVWKGVAFFWEWKLRNQKRVGVTFPAVDPEFICQGWWQRVGAMHQGAQKAEHLFSHSCGGSRSTMKVLAGLGFCGLGGKELPQASLLGL